MRRLLILLLGLSLVGGAGEARKKRHREEGAEPQRPAARPCEAGIRFAVLEEGTPPRPLSAFRYRLRIGEQRVEGGCPDAGRPGPGRCEPGGLFLPLAPDQLDVVFECPGCRPLLQVVVPAYDEAAGCRRAEVRLLLRQAPLVPQRE